MAFYSKIKKDFFGYIFFKAHYLTVSVKGTVTTYWFRFLLRLKNVDLSPGCRFIGRPIVVRHPLSKIKIGYGCTFRSDKVSNLIGVNRNCIISTHAKDAEIIIGKSCGFSGVTIGAMERIFIGDNVLIGANAIITDFDWHNIDPARRNVECTSFKPVIIDHNVFIGVNAIVWKGVSIGKNSVIGANSVVTKDIPENVIAAGNPARVIRAL